MPRVITVKKARKDQGTCGKCGEPIRAGDAYRWWKFRYGGKRIRCSKPECAPGRADLTQSDFWISVYGLEDDLAAAATREDIEGVVEQIRELAEEQQDKLYNMPEGLQEGDTGQLLQDRAQYLEDWAQEMEDAVADEEDAVNAAQDTTYGGE